VRLKSGHREGTVTSRWQRMNVCAPAFATGRMYEYLMAKYPGPSGDADELKEEICRRQEIGIPDVLPRITRISCRCCPDPIVSVNLHWSDRYKPRQALPCLMCGHQPILTAACSWRGGNGEEWATKANYWIECKCGPRQEFRAMNLIPYPAQNERAKFGHISRPHTALQLIGEWNRSLRQKVKARTM
jgi:hypothetical protein